MTLTLYTHPVSRGRIARWMLEEIGQPYEAVVLDYATSMKSSTYLALNPMGKVPTLVHDGHVVTEAAAICAYLADAFPRAGLAPQERSAYYRWLFFAAGPLEQAMVDGALGWEPPPHQERRVGYGSMQRVANALVGHFAEHRFVCGTRFTAADVYLGAQVGWALTTGALPAHPVLAEYWGRLADRPARLRAIQMDESLAKGG